MSTKPRCDIRLYAIIDPAVSSPQTLARDARAAAEGGITLLQYRDKHADTGAMVERAKGLVKALEGTGVPLLVNDRVDVALAAGADGVHIGQKDMTPADARRLLGPEAIVGLTVQSVEHAENAPADLIDYACIGGVFVTTSKDNPVSIGIDGWQKRASVLRAHAPALPVGAIAGITEDNAAGMIRAGADGIAVISAVFSADDAMAASQKLRAIIDAAGNDGGA